MKHSGYTLVEILVVISLLGLVGLILTQIFFSSLRGGNKAQTLAKMKQNGEIISEILGKNIRNADAISCVSASRDTLVAVKDGVYQRFRFNPPILEDNTTSNGFLYQEFLEKDDSSNCNPFTPRSTQPAGSQLLSDIDEKEGVSILLGRFSWDSSPGFKDAVTIDFYVRPAEKAVFKSIDAILFSTTINLR